MKHIEIDGTKCVFIEIKEGAAIFTANPSDKATVVFMNDGTVMNDNAQPTGQVSLFYDKDGKLYWRYRHLTDREPEVIRHNLHELHLEVAKSHFRVKKGQKS